MKLLTDVNGKFVTVFVTSRHDQELSLEIDGKFAVLRNYKFSVNTKYMTVWGYENKPGTEDYTLKFFDLYPTNAKKI